MTPDRPLWSERRGAKLDLTDAGFSALIRAALEKSTEEMLFDEAFGYDDRVLGGKTPGRHNRVGFFTMRMGDSWASSLLDMPVLAQFESRDRIYDLLELLYREVVSSPIDATSPYPQFRQEDGQRRFRELVNPILGRCDPPPELTEGGEIVEGVAEPFRRLVEQPLPDDAPKREVADRFDDAIAHFRRRGATGADRRAAVRELALVIEYLRPDVKEHLLSEDERMLFRLANEFAIRNNNRETRRDFDEPAWLAWAFYVYLATIRLVLELRRRGETG